MKELLLIIISIQILLIVIYSIAAYKSKISTTSAIMLGISIYSCLINISLYIKG